MISAVYALPDPGTSHSVCAVLIHAHHGRNLGCLLVEGHQSLEDAALPLGDAEGQLATIQVVPHGWRQPQSRGRLSAV
jgi:hypothetical protein